MKKEDQCCSLEQAQKLKELGVKSDGLFFWFNPSDAGNFGFSKRHEVIELFSDLCVDYKKKAAGIKDGEWFHYDKEEVRLLAEEGLSKLIDDDQADSLLTAYTVAELGIMLPDELDGENIFSQWIDERFGEPGRQFTSSILTAEMQQGWKTEAECRCAILIYMIEKKLTTAEGVNKRLAGA